MWHFTGLSSSIDTLWEELARHGYVSQVESDLGNVSETDTKKLDHMERSIPGRQEQSLDSFFYRHCRNGSLIQLCSLLTWYEFLSSWQSLFIRSIGSHTHRCLTGMRGCNSAVKDFFFFFYTPFPHEFLFHCTHFFYYAGGITIRIHSLSRKCNFTSKNLNIFSSNRRAIKCIRRLSYIFFRICQTIFNRFDFQTERAS